MFISVRMGLHAVSEPKKRKSESSVEPTQGLSTTISLSLLHGLYMCRLLLYRLARLALKLLLFSCSSSILLARINTSIRSLHLDSSPPTRFHTHFFSFSHSLLPSIDLNSFRPLSLCHLSQSLIPSYPPSPTLPSLTIFSFPVHTASYTALHILVPYCFSRLHNLRQLCFLVPGPV
ncbi:MAG: hypothetical protein J3Q66DRAFT_171873 [Benniella sp.]|nr:MAG: hypothetical protein J3Q66DRAFT_171873 [Benniella sp.]